ncbi:13556_t:CDS:2 [Ambispora leptoticha]|uniref:13556_t:CDS:1 n=1 Tax=Ambispora leptoticha TaxID=144679 RepID=A0A9N8ZE53_9GLOM|nr:13556_t:CDS:2 [Ambispora leptoticha]
MFSSSALKKKKNSPSLSKDDFNILDSYITIEGRKYHNIDGLGYPLPCDESEASRLIILHFIFRLIFGGNFSSPVSDLLSAGGMTVLDIGCGPGAWVSENCKNYPKSTFIGLDIISANFPSEKFPNAAFIQCNVLDGIPFPANTFDFIHQRGLLRAFTSKDWRNVIDEICRVLKLGGRVEFLEKDLKFINMGPIMKTFSDAMFMESAENDINPYVIHKLDEFLKDTGKIENIETIEKIAPIGSWGGRLGELIFRNLFNSLNGLRGKLLPILDISIEKYDSLLNQLEEDVNKNHTSYRLVRIFGQKKLDHAAYQINP